MPRRRRQRCQYAGKHRWSPTIRGRISRSLRGRRLPPHPSGSDHGAGMRDRRRARRQPGEECRRGILPSRQARKITTCVAIFAIASCDQRSPVNTSPGCYVRLVAAEHAAQDDPRARQPRRRPASSRRRCPTSCGFIRSATSATACPRRQVYVRSVERPACFSNSAGMGMARTRIPVA